MRLPVLHPAWGQSWYHPLHREWLVAPRRTESGGWWVALPMDLDVGSEGLRGRTMGSRGGVAKRGFL